MPDKPAAVKPAVTDEHLKKYDAIMGTQVTSKSAPAKTPPPSSNSTPSTPSLVSKSMSLLSSIPKSSGIGNKMFIFTGKKKIIIDGNEKEVEDVKTVDQNINKDELKKIAEETRKVKEAEIKKQDQEKEHLSPNALFQNTPTKEDKKPVKPEDLVAKKVETVEIKKEEPKVKKSRGKSGIPTVVLVLVVVIFFIAWTFFWLVLFGFITF